MTRVLNIVLRSALLVALVASTAMFVDYTAASPAFCGVQSSCGAVRDSMFSHIAGVPLPAVGMGTFIGVFAMAVWASRPRHYKWLSWQLGLVGIGAVVLIGLQLFVVKAICAWCMAVDISAIIAAVCAALLANREPNEEITPMRYLWGGVCIAAVAVPLMWEVKAPEAEVPEGVAAHYVQGKVNIVTFTDFECPFCRRMHSPIHDAVDKNKGRVNVVRLMMPLSFHQGAEPAALGYLCTPDAVKEGMASQLYDAPTAKLTARGVVEIAKAMNLDSSKFAKCMESAETRKTLETQMELFKSAQLRGLPSTFVGKQLIAGANEPALMAAIDDALASDGKTTGSPIEWMFALLAALLAAVVAISVKAAQPAEDAETEYA